MDNLIKNLKMDLPLVIFVHGFTSNAQMEVPQSETVNFLRFDWDAGKTPAGWPRARYRSLPFTAPLLLYFLASVAAKHFPQPI